jgi:hypothetical protein
MNATENTRPHSTITLANQQTIINVRVTEKNVKKLQKDNCSEYKYTFMLFYFNLKNVAKTSTLLKRQHLALELKPQTSF